ncbi:MAG TPA: ATP-binding cassette domain-containing protein, partial [Limnochordales bacterium]
LLERVGLKGMAHSAASELSGGQQRLLEFARALMTGPRLVLMDEPFAGVHPAVVEVMSRHMQALRGEGTSFVVVSHEIPVLMALSDRIICLDRGKVIAEGTPEEIRNNEAVIEAYLGSAAHS